MRGVTRLSLSLSTAAAMAALAIGASLAPPAGAAKPDALAGTASTGVRLVNLDPNQPRTPRLSFYRVGESSPREVILDPLDSGAARSLYLPAQPELLTGHYTAHLASDGMIGAYVNTLWSGSDSTIMSESATPGNHVVLPLLQRGVGSRNTYLAVQNADAVQAATIHATLTGTGTAATAAEFDLALPAGQGTSINLGDDPRLAGLPSEFTGSLRLHSDRPITAQAIEEWRDGRAAAYDYLGVPAEQWHTTLYLARFRAGETSPVGPAGYYDSSIAVANPGTEAVTATVTYHGESGACAGDSLAHGRRSWSIPPGSMLMFSAGADGADRPTGPSFLPDDCGGTASVRATGPIAAVAVETLSVDGQVRQAGGYNALGENEAATWLSLPLLRRTSFGSVTYSTDIVVVNPSSAVADVTLRARVGKRVEVVAPTVRIPAGGSHTWLPENVAGWPDDTYGSGTLESTAPVIAMVADIPRSGSKDSGYALALHRPQAGHTAAHALPWLANSAQLPGQAAVVPTIAPPISPSPTPESSPPPQPAGPKGFAITGLQMVNLDTSGDLIAQVRAHSLSSDFATDLTVPPFRNTYTVYPPVDLRIARGGYGVTLTADRPMALMASTVFAAPGELGRQTSAAAMEAPTTGTDVVVPAVFKGQAGQNSLVAIQNADDADAEVTVTLIDAAGGEPAATTDLTLAPGKAHVFDVGRDPAFVDVPLGFAGTLRATSTARLAVQSIVDVEDSAGAVYGFNGVPVTQAAGTLFVPRVRHAASPLGRVGDWGLQDSVLAVANIGSVPADVTTTYIGWGGSCAGQVIQTTGEALHLAAGGMAVIDQAAAASGLPVGCVAAARLEAAGANILAVVADRLSEAGTVTSATAENAFTLAEADTAVALPVVVRNLAPPSGYSSHILVMNVGTTPVTATLDVNLSDPPGPLACGAACTRQIPPLGVVTWLPDEVPGWPDNSFGTAILRASGPIVSVVDYGPRRKRHDEWAYRGVPFAGANAADLRRSAVPILMNDALVRRPGPALADGGGPAIAAMSGPLHLPLVHQRFTRP